MTRHLRWTRRRRCAEERCPMGSDGNVDGDGEIHDCRTFDNRRETAEETPVSTIC